MPNWWESELDSILQRGREIQNETQPSFGAPSGPEKPWWEQLGGTINQAGQWALGQAETAKNAINQSIIEPLTTPQLIPPTPTPQPPPSYGGARDYSGWAVPPPDNPLQFNPASVEPVTEGPLTGPLPDLYQRTVEEPTANLPPWVKPLAQMGLSGLAFPWGVMTGGYGAATGAIENKLTGKDVGKGAAAGFQAGPWTTTEAGQGIGGYLAAPFKASLPAELGGEIPKLTPGMTPMQQRIANVPLAWETMEQSVAEGKKMAAGKPFHTAKARIEAGEDPKAVYEDMKDQIDLTSDMFFGLLGDPTGPIGVKGPVDELIGAALNPVAKAGKRAAAVVSTADEAEDMIARSIAQFNAPQQARALDPLNPTKWLDATAGTRQRALVEESQDALGNVSGNFRDQLRAIAADPNAAQFTESPLLINFRDALSSGQSVDEIEAALMPQLLHQYVLNPVRTANELGLGSNALNEQAMRGVALVRQMVTDEAGRVMPDRLVNRMAEAATAFKDNPAAVADAQLQIMVEEMSGAAKRIYPEAELPGVMAKGAQWRDATNNFFNGLYLGMSPSYAVRNALNNVVTGVVDVGPGMLTTNTAAVLADLYPSGTYPKGTTRAFGPTEMSGNLRRATEQKLATARQELIQAKQSNNGQRITRAQKNVDRLASKVERSGAWKLPGTVLGQKGESSIGGKIWTKKVQEVLPDVLNREVQIPDFVLTGLSPEQRNYLRAATAITHNQGKVMRHAARVVGGNVPIVPDPEALTTLARHNSQWADLVLSGQSDVALRQAEQQAARATENAADAVATRLAPDVADAVEDLRNVARAGDMDAARLSEFEKKVLANQERVMNARRQVTTHKARQTFGDMIGDGVEQSDTLDRQAFAESRAFRAETWKQYRAMQDAGAPRAQKAALWDNYHAVQDQRFTVLTDRKVQLWNDISTQMKRGGKPPAAAVPIPNAPTKPGAPSTAARLSKEEALDLFRPQTVEEKAAAAQMKVADAQRFHDDLVAQLERERAKRGPTDPVVQQLERELARTTTPPPPVAPVSGGTVPPSTAPSSTGRAVDEFADLGTKYRPAGLTGDIAKRAAWKSRIGGDLPRTAEQWAAVEPDKMRYWSEYLDARAANKGLTPKNHPKYEQWQAQQALPTEAAAVPEVAANVARPDPQAAIKAKLAAMQPDTAEQQAIRAAEQQAAEAGRASTLQQEAAAKMQAEVERKQAMQVEAQQKVTDRIAVADIQVDADRFQFKIGTGPGGITPQLSKVKQWNPALGAGVSVWTDPSSGQTFVVNGHHRVALAKRLGVAYIESPYFIKAATAEEARTTGALQNIASGRGTEIDAAKFFRDSGFLPETLAGQGVSLSESKVRDGIALAGLHPSLFGAVTRGEITVKRGVIIGEKITDADLQFQFVKQLDKEIGKGKKITDEVVAELADAVVSGPKETITQADMFGTMSLEKSYSVERAQLAAFVRGKLAKDKRLFGMAARNAGELSRVGEIDQAAALGISTESGQLLEIFDRIKNQKGPIGDALNNAAAKLGKGAKINEVENEVYEAIVRDLPEALSSRAAGSVAEPGGARLFGEAEAGPGPAAPEAQPGLFGEAAAPVDQSVREAAAPKKVSVARITDQFKAKGAPTEGWVDQYGRERVSYSGDAYTEEYMARSDKTKRLLRYAVTLSDGRTVSMETALQLTHPEAWAKIENSRGLLKKETYKSTVWGILDKSEKQSIIDSVNWAKAVGNETDQFKAENQALRYLHETDHFLDGMPAAQNIINLETRDIVMGNKIGKPVYEMTFDEYIKALQDTKRIPKSDAVDYKEWQNYTEYAKKQHAKLVERGKTQGQPVLSEAAAPVEQTPKEVWQKRRQDFVQAGAERDAQHNAALSPDEPNYRRDKVYTSTAASILHDEYGIPKKKATEILTAERSRYAERKMRSVPAYGPQYASGAGTTSSPTYLYKREDVHAIAHDYIVKKAVSEGKPVPQEILDEAELYKDNIRGSLAEKQQGQVKAEQKQYITDNLARNMDEQKAAHVQELRQKIQQVQQGGDAKYVAYYEDQIAKVESGQSFDAYNELYGRAYSKATKEATQQVPPRSSAAPAAPPATERQFLPTQQAQLYDVDPATGERISRRRYTENPLTDLAQANVDANQEAVNILRRMAEAQRMAPTSTGMTPQARKAFQQWVKQGWLPGVDKARSIAADVATRARDFALLNYGTRKNIDTLMYNFFPYGYWQTHSIPNWLGRIAQHPNIAANALRFKKMMEDLNKDRPEWYKLNVDVGPLFGADDPMYVNALQSLMPLYNLVGMDFNDPDRKSMLGKVTQFLGNQGYSVWTPAVWALAFGLYSQGQKDEARSMMGYAAPITKAVKSATALAGVNQGQGLTVEPYLWSEGGIGKGMDKWDQNRAGVALLAMQQRGDITPEQAQDAAYQKSGDVWDRALAEVMQGPPGAPWEGRALPSLAAWGIGTGFKPRSKADELLYQAQQDVGKLYEQQASMSKDQWGAAWDEIDRKYPFYGMTRMAKKTGEPESDTARAWEVLNRLPPGNPRKGLLQNAGITDALVDKFYDSKGDMSAWSEPDRLRMQAGIEALAAGVKIPNEAQQVEYATAKDANQQMYAQGEQRWPGVQQTEQAYFALPTAQRKAFVAAHPELKQWWDFKDQYRVQTGTGQYYGKAETQPTDLVGMAYKTAEERWPGIFDTQNAYFQFPEQSYERRMYLNQHPELKQYWDFMRTVKGQPQTLFTSGGRGFGGGGSSSAGGPPRTREVGGKANRKSYGGGGGGAKKSWYQQYKPWWLGLRWNVNTRGRA